MPDERRASRAVTRLPERVERVEDAQDAPVTDDGGMRSTWGTPPLLTQHEHLWVENRTMHSRVIERTCTLCYEVSYVADPADDTYAPPRRRTTVEIHPDPPRSILSAIPGWSSESVGDVSRRFSDGGMLPGVAEAVLAEPVRTSRAWSHDMTRAARAGGLDAQDVADLAGRASALAAAARAAAGPEVGPLQRSAERWYGEGLPASLRAEIAAEREQNRQLRIELERANRERTVAMVDALTGRDRQAEQDRRAARASRLAYLIPLAIATSALALTLLLRHLAA